MIRGAMTHFDDDGAEARWSRRARLYDAIDEGKRGSARSLASVLLAVAVCVLLGTLSCSQVSREMHARNAIAAGIAATTDIDMLLAQNVDELRRQANSPKAPDTYRLPEYPINVLLTRDEVLDNDTIGLREILLQRSATVVYHDGLSAFDRTGNQSVGLFSMQRVMDIALGQIGDDWHTRSTKLAQAVAFAVALLAVWVGVSYAAEPLRAFKALGIATAAGALPGIVFPGAVLAWVELRASGDPFLADLQAVLRALTAVPFRNSLIVLGCGVVIALLTPALTWGARWVDGANAAEDPLAATPPPVREDVPATDPTAKPPG
jgi:hypothetical protein